MSENIAPENLGGSRRYGKRRLRAASAYRGARRARHGHQRALDTVRGVVDAVWLDKDEDPGPGDKRFWLHPERKHNDLDLSVITTNEVKETPDQRSVDFHELYWAHLMSETRAVAVLLWLFELVRKGPRLKPGMRALWWGATIFLCLLVQSVVLLVLHGVLLFLGAPPLISDAHISVRDGQAISFFCSTSLSRTRGAAAGAVLRAVHGGFLCRIFLGVSPGLKLWSPRPCLPWYRACSFTTASRPGLRWFTSLFLPIIVSLCVAGVAMGCGACSQ